MDNAWWTTLTETMSSSTQRKNERIRDFILTAASSIVSRSARKSSWSKTLKIRLGQYSRRSEKQCKAVMISAARTAVDIGDPTIFPLALVAEWVAYVSSKCTEIRCFLFACFYGQFSILVPVIFFAIACMGYLAQSFCNTTTANSWSCWAGMISAFW